ncbi:uncharacterized protein LOC120135907 [Hibiscus syriacus]|uniref:uncharacterized protein LOC120135907 n=1 Tax=Hibiscus syriacus TaxID=106335 RepID=UPI0019228C1E|nr:uncharacterized protein LOC120135907 [Hibiscus syriacus]
MKKMKGIVAAAAAVAVKEYFPYDLYEDQRARFRYPNHMEEFEDLHKETESMRKKLQTKEKRSTLSAEVSMMLFLHNLYDLHTFRITVIDKELKFSVVRFLKRRHKFLIQYQSSNSLEERHFFAATEQSK